MTPACMAVSVRSTLMLTNSYSNDQGKIQVDYSNNTSDFVDASEAD